MYHVNKKKTDGGWHGNYVNLLHYTLINMLLFDHDRKMNKTAQLCQSGVSVPKQIAHSQQTKSKQSQFSQEWSHIGMIWLIPLAYVLSDRLADNPKTLHPSRLYQSKQPLTVTRVWISELLKEHKNTGTFSRIELRGFRLKVFWQHMSQTVSTCHTWTMAENQASPHMLDVRNTDLVILLHLCCFFVQCFVQSLTEIGPNHSGCYKLPAIM